MRVTGKLISTYLLIVGIIIILGLISIHGLKQINQNGETMYQNQVIPLTNLIAITQLAENTRVQMVSSVLNEDPSFTDIAEENLGEINKYISEYERFDLGTEEKETFQAFVKDWISFSEIVRNNISLVNKGDYEAAKAGLAKGGVPYTAASEYLHVLQQINEKEAASISNENGKIYQDNLILVYVSILISAIIAIILGVIMGRIFGGPLKKVAGWLDKIATGDLTGDSIKSTRKDEIGQLITATNQLNIKMQNIVFKINEVAGTVLSHSEELTQSANEVKMGAEQITVTVHEIATGSGKQADYSSDVASIMASLSKKAQEADENSQNIKKSSTKMFEMTNEGSYLMESSTAQMNKINEMVRKTTDLISGLNDQSEKISNLGLVIKDIANQTNLLALNASIEAARAGEHGKGFAVVADEVKKLAEQVGVSVEDITNTVNHMQNEVTLVTEFMQNQHKEIEQGTEQIKTTGETFRKISTSISETVNNIKVLTENIIDISANTQMVSSSIEEIAAISEESAAGTEQTSAACEQTSSSMEEIVCSSGKLSQLAEELNGLVGLFKLSN